MAVDRFYLVRLDDCRLDATGAVLSICNSIVQSDRDRVYHSMTLTLGMIYPPDRLPRPVRRNLSSDEANQMVVDLTQAGAVATVVEQR